MKFTSDDWINTIYNSVKDVDNKNVAERRNVLYNNSTIGEVKNVPIEDLLPLKTDGGYRNEKQNATLRENIKKNGITTPIELVRNNDGSIEIENGNHRLQIANELGLKEVPVKFVNSWENIGIKKDTSESKFIESNEVIENDRNNANGRGVNKSNVRFRTREGNQIDNRNELKDRRTAERDDRISREVERHNDRSSSNTTSKENEIQGTESETKGNEQQKTAQRYQYIRSDNIKIDNLRRDASKYFNNSEETQKYINILEKITQAKDIEIRLDSTLTDENGNMANGKYQNGIITINPNSTRSGEFIAIHELTHAIGTKSMMNIIENYRKSNPKFDESVKKLLENYNQSEITEESLADVSAQLFGTQEFIDNLSQKNPNLFRRIYNQIKYLWHQFRGYKNQFIEDLKYKWEKAYRNNKELNNTTNYSIAGIVEDNYESYSNDIENNANIEYNIKGIDITNQEYNRLRSAINTDTPNLKNGTNVKEFGEYFYIFNKNDFDSYTVLGRIEIEGNEDIVKILREEITNGVITNSKGFSSSIKRLENDRRRNNSSNDSSTTTREDKQTSGLYSRTTQEESIRQSEINNKGNGNKSRIENSNQSSFSMQKDNQGRQLTKEQGEYFKDSKVRDENGNLKTVYHGTTNEFNVFNYDKLGENTSSLGAGFYFTDKKETGQEYTRGTGNLKEVYLDIKKASGLTWEKTASGWICLNYCKKS